MSIANYNLRKGDRSNLTNSNSGFNARLLVAPENMSDAIGKERVVLKRRSGKARELGMEFKEKILQPMDEAVTRLQDRIAGLRSRIANKAFNLSVMQVHAIEERIRHNQKLERLNMIIEDLSGDGARLEACGRASEREDLRLTHGMSSLEVCKMLRIEVGTVNREIEYVRAGLQKTNRDMGHYRKLRNEAIQLAQEISQEIESAILEQAARNDRVMQPLKNFSVTVRNTISAIAQGTSVFAYRTAAIGIAAFSFIAGIFSPVSLQNSANAAPPSPTPAVQARQENNKRGAAIMDEQTLRSYFNGIYTVEGRSVLTEEEFQANIELFHRIKAKDKTFTLEEFIELYQFHRFGSYDAISKRWTSKHSRKMMMALFEEHLETKKEIWRMIAREKNNIDVDKLTDIRNEMTQLLGAGMFNKAMDMFSHEKDGMKVYSLYKAELRGILNDRLRNARRETSDFDMSSR